MPSLLHEGIVALFRHNPGLALELLERVGGVALAGGVASAASEAAPQFDPVTLAADSVIVLRADGFDAKPIGAVIIEVQLSPNDDKRAAWPFYVASHHRSLGCPVWLIVVTVDEAVARWALQPIVIAPRQFVLEPIVLGPSTLPPLTEPSDIARYPELTLLLALAHARDADAVPIVAAAFDALCSLDADAGRIYFDVLMARLGKLAKATLEAAMTQRHHEYESDFAKHYYGEGKAQGKAEGEAKGKAEGEAKGKAEGEAKGKADAILAILVGRGIAVSSEVSTRVRACADVATLDRWVVRAVTAITDADVFAPD